MTRVALCLLPCLGAAFGLAMTMQAHEAPNELKVTFDEQGLSSIVHNRIVLHSPEDERFKVFYLRFPTPDGGFRQVYEPVPTRKSFDPKSKIALLEFDWGRAECSYTLANNTLDCNVKVTNTAKEPIAPVVVFPLRLRLPKTATNLDAKAGPLGTLLEHENGTIALVNWNQLADLSVRSAYSDLRTKSAPVGVSNRPPRHSKHPVVDNENFNDPGTPIPPGEIAEYRISLVFGASGSTVADLCPTLQEKFVSTNPVILNWPDRRPIATIFFAHPAKGWKSNPRGYNFGKADKNNVATKEGLREFGRDLLAYADRCVATMKEMNAQGVIVWDLEGEEMPHMISYVGDPRRLPRVAPEMDRFADAFFKKFSDAGLKSGLTIRPTEYFERNPGKRDWWQRDVKDPVALLSAKILYAQRRWGCRIFYVDSNVFGTAFDTVLPKDHNVPWVMPVAMIKRLHELHPDCLIIPEWSDDQYYRYSSQYSSPNLRQMGTPQQTRTNYPGAFRVVGVNPWLLEEHWDNYLDSVCGGDVLLFPTWYSASENVVIKMIYREAMFRSRPVAEISPNVDLSTLLSSSNPKDEFTRYWVAGLLGERADAESLRPLFAMLSDSSPVVRKAALVALGRRKQATKVVVNELAHWLLKPKDSGNSALRSFVANALGSLGEAAVPNLAAFLDEKDPDIWPYSIRALGQTGTRDPRAIEALLASLRDKTRYSLRESTVRALGSLKAQQAVPALLDLLKSSNKDEDVRKAIVVALGQIRDPRAIEPLIREFAYPYHTVVVYSIRDCLDESLSAITGQRGLLGGDDWQKWHEHDHSEPK